MVVCQYVTRCFKYRYHISTQSSHVSCTAQCGFLPTLDLKKKIEQKIQLRRVIDSFLSLLNKVLSEIFMSQADKNVALQNTFVLQRVQRLIYFIIFSSKSFRRFTRITYKSTEIFCLHEFVSLSPRRSSMHWLRHWLQFHTNKLMANMAWRTMLTSRYASNWFSMHLRHI